MYGEIILRYILMNNASRMRGDLRKLVRESKESASCIINMAMKNMQKKDRDMQGQL